jgi:hypothetical protein
MKTKVVHSESKDAWNVVGTEVGNKFKIARIPYLVVNNEIFTTRNKNEALEHALFISKCFNTIWDKKNCYNNCSYCGHPEGNHAAYCRKEL